MASQTPLRTGLVGCGWHGNSLAQAIVRSSSLQLVACADPDHSAASRAATHASDVSTHASVEGLLAESEVDAVVVATPHHLLGPVALAAIRAGKHVMAEKPIALNEREAAEIERAVAQAGVCYMAGYSFRFSMTRHVHQLLRQNVVGDIQAIVGSIGIGPMNEDWIAYPETGGGPMLFIGSHLIDAMLWFMNDDPREVYAHVTRRADTGADKTSTFQIRFARGGMAQGLVTQSAGGFFYDIQTIGSAGRLALRGQNFLQFEIEVTSKTVAAYQEPTFIRPSVWRDSITGMLVPELEEFACAIREGRPASVTASDGRRVLRVIDGIAQSGEHNEAVLLA